MTRVSFYVLNDPAADREAFICRLLERVYEQGQLAYAYAPDPIAQRQLDERLWTQRQGSFIPHDHESADSTSPIVIGGGHSLPAQRDVLLNLDFAAAEPPSFFSSFERMLEIVAGADAEKASARRRFGYYRDRGYELDTFQIS